MKKKLLICLVCFLSATFRVYAAAPLSIKILPGADRVVFQELEPNRILLAVHDHQNEPVLNLTTEDLLIRQGAKTARITSVEPLVTSKDVGLNIVLVVDNSFSMKKRQAVEPLLEALNAFIDTIRPIDRVQAVVFDQKNTVALNGRQLHARVFTNDDTRQLKAFFRRQLTEGITNGTFLYDAMAVGLDLTGRLPADQPNFLVVFSDGRDINSALKASDVTAQAKTAGNFSAYAVDYMPRAEPDPFLKAFTARRGGRVWKASAATELLPIFKSFSSTLLHRYVVTYRFLAPPQGALQIQPNRLKIEELTTVDSSPLLNYVYFATGQSRLPDKYHLFKKQAQAAAFDIAMLKDAFEKHCHLLNIVGKRMASHPQARLKLVGCNADTGEEKGRLDLSRSRAEAVKSYLQYIWDVDAERIRIEARNRPQHASSNRLDAGRVENQRVEIYADTPAILDTVQTTYIEKISDTANIVLTPHIKAEVPITSWKIKVRGDQDLLKLMSGDGDLPARIDIAPADLDLGQLARYKDLRIDLEILDAEANRLDQTDAVRLPITFVQRQKQMTQQRGYKMLEKYALILFDYDSATIKDQNKTIVARIAGRLAQLPAAQVKITGHTDNIGTEKYNLKLAQRRAAAVNQQLTATGSLKDRDAATRSVGPHEPLYTNDEPAGRALNRTVTVSLEYEKQ